jgi:hypothetical protein
MPPTRLSLNLSQRIVSVGPCVELLFEHLGEEVFAVLVVAGEGPTSRGLAGGARVFEVRGCRGADHLAFHGFSPDPPGEIDLRPEAVL